MVGEDTKIRRDHGHPYKNIDPFEIPEKADKTLNEYWDIAESLGITTFLLYGTCLGFVRDGGYIKGDNDIDVGILGGLDELIVKLVEDGFIKKGVWLQRGNCHLFKHDTLLDIWFTFPNHTFLQSFSKVAYKGRSYNIPNPIEKFLEISYGDWKVPSSQKGMRR